MAENLSNDIATTLNNSGTLSSGATSMVVTSSTGFPSANFRVRVDDELMLVTNVAGATWTVTRGIEGTSAASHADGTSVYHVLTTGGLAQYLIDRYLALGGGTLTGPLNVYGDTNGLAVTLVGRASDDASVIRGANNAYSAVTGALAFYGTVGVYVYTKDTTAALKLVHVASAVNYPTLSPNVAFGGVTYGADGSDTNIGINVTPKGSVQIALNSSTTTTGTATATVAVAAPNVWSAAKKTTTETKTTNTTLADDAALVLAVAANTTYRIRIRAFVSGLAGAGNFKWRITGPASPTGVLISTNVIGDGGPGFAFASAFHTSDQTSTAFTNNFFDFEILLVNGANAGTVALRWAQNASSGTGTSVQVGSTLESMTF